MSMPYISSVQFSDESGSLEGLHGCAASMVFMQTVQDAITKGHRRFLAICPSNQRAKDFFHEVCFFSSPSTQVIFLADTETLPYDEETIHGALHSERTRSFDRILKCIEEDSPVVVIASVLAVLRRLPEEKHWVESRLSIRAGDKFNAEKLEISFHTLGYQRVQMVKNFGEFAIRNESIIDVRPFGEDSAFRITGKDGLCEVSLLNLVSQRSVDSVEYFNCMHSREFGVDEQSLQRFSTTWRKEFGIGYRAELYKQVVSDKVLPPGIESYLPLFVSVKTLFEYLPESATFIDAGVIREADKYLKLASSRYQELAAESGKFILPPNKLWMTSGELLEVFGARQLLSLDGAIPTNRTIVNEVIETNFSRQPTIAETVNMLGPWIKHVGRVVYCMNSHARRNEMQLLCEMLGQNPQWLDTWQEFETRNIESTIAICNVKKGCYIPEMDLLFVTEREIFGQPIFQKEESLDDEVDYKRLQDFASLTLGQPMVHLKYGVGRFAGLQILNLGSVAREYLKIQYADDAHAFVPMADLDYVSRYNGLDPDSAPLNAMNSEKWAKEIQYSFDSIKRTASQLIDVYKEKEVKIGVSINEPDYRYEKFCAEFPFTETRDQVSAVNEIISDLSSTRPMDRIVCGDVGFGKTEVFMRAAFLVAASALQVVVMVPSTILAQQHFETFKQRFSSFDYKIALITRNTSTKELNDLLRDLSVGRIHILIGTHRVLQSDVKYLKLGLLVIDEEHRFGVEQKAKLLKLRSSVNVLSATATPIPRTLSLSMHGIRDLSVIATPPAKRLSVKTHVVPYSDTLVISALKREMLRGGQVFYLYNDIETIYSVAERISKAVEGVRVAIAHGKMNDVQLENVMASFYRGDFDVLVCTTIIETGIDVPNANTIIIERSDKLGLAQLHQLRGRVGRSDRQAYAYITYHEGIAVNSLKRLKVMTDASSLGEGFTLASQDLEIRGAGEILGQEQSGYIQAIGFQLYMMLLERAISVLQQGRKFNGQIIDEGHTTIDVGVDAVIPSNYIEMDALRLSVYKKLASTKSDEELNEIREACKDQFGPIPPLMARLFDVIRLRIKCSNLQIKRLLASDKSGELEFFELNARYRSRIEKLAHKDPTTYQVKNDKLIFSCTSKPDSRLNMLESVIASIL